MHERLTGYIIHSLTYPEHKVLKPRKFFRMAPVSIFPGIWAFSSPFEVSFKEHFKTDNIKLLLKIPLYQAARRGNKLNQMAEEARRGETEEGG